MTSFITFAQTEKGKWTIGASSNGLFRTSKVADADNDTRFTSFSISPDAGYFFADNFAVGLRLGLSKYKIKGAKEGSAEFTVAPFLRYYILKPTSKKINVFADASYGFGSSKMAFIEDAASINKFTIQAGPAFWLNEIVAIDATLFYNSRGGEGIENRYNTIGASFGFRLSLGGAK